MPVDIIMAGVSLGLLVFAFLLLGVIIGIKIVGREINRTFR